MKRHDVINDEDLQSDNGMTAKLVGMKNKSLEIFGHLERVSREGDRISSQEISERIGKDYLKMKNRITPDTASL